jgi:leader peptidase (prepilin peptidase)/N-methyltransferase
MSPWRRGAVLGLAALLVVAWAVSADADPQRLLLGSVLGWSLLALAWIDLNTLRLPDALTLPLTAVGLAAAWLDPSSSLLSSLIGAVAGYGAFLGVQVLYQLARGREGLGRGDAKLLAAGGAWLGWQALPWVVLLAALLGLALALLYRMRGARLTADTAVPFGPPLAFAIWIIWLYGVPIE